MKMFNVPVFLILFYTVFAFAAEEVDAEIIKNIEFFEQMDVVKNLDLASAYGQLTAANGVEKKTGVENHEN